MSIKAVDTVRTADSLDALDAEGYEGRWLDVPRLPAQNPTVGVASSLWSGRAAAAMVFNYFCKLNEKPDEMIGHDDGEALPGPNGAKMNLRYGGGSQSGKIAGVDETGKVDVQAVLSKGGLSVEAVSFCKPNEELTAQQGEKRLQPIIDQLKKNNPVILYTAMAKGEGGHIVVVSGYKRTREGSLWLRITDPDAPKDSFIGGEYKVVTPPAGPEAMFSEYWLRAAALFRNHPTSPPRKLYSYTGSWGRYLFVVPAKAVPDDHELVHRLALGASAGDAEQEEPEAAALGGKSESAAAKSAKKDEKKPEADEGGDEEEAPEKKEEAPAKESGKPIEEIEPAVVAGDYKEAGAWSGGKFANADLQKLLEHYCKADGIDAKEMSKKGAEKRQGGDLEVTASEELPKWYTKWRDDVALRPKWDKYCEGRSRLGEAFSRAFFREMCKKNSVEYPPSADEFFAHLWKSTANGRSKDMGGPSGIYCAAASSLGLERYLNGKGYKLTSGKVGTMICKTIGIPKISDLKILPGDVLSIVSAGTPRTGHVVTVLCSLSENTKGGVIWVVSGNCGPRGNVAVDILDVEERDPRFNPFKPGDDGKTPLLKWQPDDKRPSAGKCWIYADQRGSDFMPGKLGEYDDAQLAKLNLKKVEPKETPGSKPGKVKQDAPPPEEKKDEDEKEEKKDGEQSKDEGKEKKDSAKEKDEDGDEEEGDEGEDEKGGGEAKKKEPKPKAKHEGDPPPAACPPKTGFPRLPITLNGSLEVTGANLTDLYHSAERGNGGFFPLGDSLLFHCGIHLQPASGSQCHAIADGEVVAAKMGVGPGQHPWGDTGFVLTRHVVKGDKNVYSLFLHLKKEPLHPDRTQVGWLKRLLIAAMGGDPPKKTKWRVIEALPTWTDEDKGKFSPTTVKNDKLLEAGVYEEEEQVFLDSKNYVKLKGLWIRGAGGAGDEARIKELSPWSSFDIDEACKSSAFVKALNEGKTAVLDKDKKDDKRRWTVDAGEAVGTTGTYLAGPTLHWSVFTKDAVFPTGSLLDEEWGAADEVKLADLDLSSKDHGTPDHGKALVEALDPDKKVFGQEEDESIVQPIELRKFYRTPTLGWRGRYQAVKGLVDFKLDVEKLMGQDRYKSHAEDARNDFKTNAKPLLFWEDLADADDFPADGKAIFIHPVTAVRLMASVAVAQDQDDPKELPGGIDRLHADEDVVLSLRDKDGPMAAVKVTVKADGKVVKTGTTDAAGELVVQLEDLAGKEVEVSVDEAAVGKDGMLVTLVNETSGKSTLQPGDSPGNQVINGKDVAPDPKLDLVMRVKAGAKAIVYQSWDSKLFKPENPASENGLKAGTTVDVERFLFRRTDGKFEAIEAVVDGQRSYLWSIEDGKTLLEPEPPKTGSGEHKDPAIYATWSQRHAQQNEHPVLAGRVQNVDEGKELELSFFAIRAIEAPAEDVQLEMKKVKVVAGGLSADFDPAQLIAGQNLLNAPRPVYAKVKIGEKTISLRDQAVTIYALGTPLPDPKPAPPEANKGDGKPMAVFASIKRGGATEKMTLWDGSPAATRKLGQLGEPAKSRFVSEENADDVYVGTITTMPHLALEEEARMAPQAALEHHKEETLKSEPDAPAWVFSSPSRAAVADNGIATGLCATHCKTEVCAEGVATGCTEEIRVRNLGSCYNAHHGECQKAVEPVQIGKKPKVNGCGGYAGSCAEVNHDKSKCFVADPVLGAGAGDRERWSVALPLRIKNDKAYDYKGALRVLLVNPTNGKAVVASQEARGPSSKCESHGDFEQISVKKDELKDKGRIAACSYEVAWRLGLPRSGAGDPVVLLAFVPVTTALGPVPDDKVFALRKSATREQIAGSAQVPASLPAPPRPPIPKPGQPPPPPPPPGPDKTAKVTNTKVPAPPEPEEEEPEEGGKKLVEVRAKMVEIAKGEVGKVDDRGGEGGKRKGWEQLKDYLEKALALDAEKQGWTAALQKPGGRAGGLHWCGIFAVWCAIKAGVDVKWKLGTGPTGLGRYRTDRNYKPGDILVCKGNLNHHCVLTAIAPDGKLETVNGNSFYQSVSLAMRDPGEISLYYRLSDQDYEG